MTTRAPAARSAAKAAPARADDGGGSLHRNEVVLVGRLAAAAEERTLPSGDVMLSWRLVVDRPPAARSAERRTPTLDTLDCVAWRGDVQRSAGAWSVGDTVEVSGAMRRRFWRSPGGPVSRTEVEVLRARRVARAE
ncbi:MAG TPA: single-stranded DNA-binding protein [Mycobacteriales bacterium]|jgi:single-strand DNA-binding protein|nr:single-stranded DNA-binding protein [Mycobacteriales bacterium]